MGTEKRRDPGKDNVSALGVPGPHAYNIPTKVFLILLTLSQIVEGPKISMSPRIQYSNLAGVKLPGPGAYSPKGINTKDFKYSFGLKTSSNFDTKQNNPGPGSYEVHKISIYSKRGASLGKTANNFFTNKDALLVPGPGQYS